MIDTGSSGFDGDSRHRPSRPSPDPGGHQPFDNNLFGANPQASQPPPRPQTPRGGARQHSQFITPPQRPSSIEETGLSLQQVNELVLKQLYLQGNLQGSQIARLICLPFSIANIGLQFLKDEKCVEVMSGEYVGPASYKFNLTDFGRRRAREAFDECRYVGPAPVSLEQYVLQCRRQSVTEASCPEDILYEAFSDVIMPDGLIEELGPAICSGKSIFVYGPPGNGKTMIAKGLGRFLNSFGGEIYVPYAVDAEGSIMTLFDPTIHVATDNEARVDHGRRKTDNQSSSDLHDLRWRKIRRPVVITGGELTMDMLDLSYNSQSHFHTAPLHIKANGGVFLIDDFGRQIVSPRELLNRWIVPLEEHVDYLTLVTGRKFQVPFEQLIVFSTNLDPRELVDEAFLRRIRHKIKIGPPSRDVFTEIFQRCCASRQFSYDPSCVDYLYSNYYDRGKPPRSSDPRDLLDIAQSICRFRNVPSHLTPELIAEATERFFCQV